MMNEQKRKIAVHAIRVLLVFLIVSFITLTIVFNIILRRNLENSLMNQLEQDTEIITEVINTYFTKYDEVVRQMYANPALIRYLQDINSYEDHRNHPEVDFISLILSNIEDSGDYISLAWLGIRSFNGIIIPDKTYEIHPNYVMDGRPWFEDMLLNPDGITHTRPYIDRVTGNLIISIVAPVYDEDVLIGNVGIDINIGDIQNFIETYKIGNDGYAFLLNKDGEYIVHPDPTYEMRENILDAEVQLARIGREMIQGKLGVGDYVTEFNTFYIAYGPIELNDWSVASVIPQSELRTQLVILNVMSTAILIAAIIIFIIFFVNLRINKDYTTLKKLYEEIQIYADQLAAKDEYIQNLAYLDPLTGIANRRRFLEYLEDSLSSHHKGAVAMVDLDNFKEINDTLGHVYGDRLLTQIAGMLSSLQEDEHIKVCRFGGDEFLLLLDDLDDLAEITLRAQRVLDLFSKKLIVDGDEIYIGMSMGLSLYPQDSRHVNQLIMNADLAMYRMKNSGKNNYVFFDKSMTEEMVERTKIESTLRDALHNEEFHLLYQPQIDVNTCHVTGFEALIRIKDNILYPNQFIPIAEESGSIIAIGRWVVNEVIQQLSLWREQGLTLKPVAINFSAKQIEDTEFLDYLLHLLDKHSISPSLIDIEITETAIMENKDEAIELLENFRASGIHLSLDDFGTGYSSLSYLTFLPIDKIKLDKSLCDRYLEPTTIKVVENIIDISHTLGMQVIAEGIESADQYHLLKDIGCDAIQGFLFSRPITPQHAARKYDHDFSDMLDEPVNGLR